MKKLEAVIFDMDGLLVDSEPLWSEAEIEVAKKVGIDLTNDLILETRGFRADEVIDYWYKKYPWENPSRPELFKEFVDLIISLIESRAVLLPGAQEAIAVCRGVGCKVSLASSSHMSIIEAVIEKFNLGDAFDSIHSAETEEKGKPDPAVYLTACRALNADPKNCLAVEDSVNGMRAAKAAGMYCIAVPAEEEREDKRFELADLKLKSLEEINENMLLAFVR
ncbi:MAG: hypothetical protein A2469_03595 [Candidatus Magasanikbacteria bacterium RIFOXYC2_FULL_40_16]|uniref:2-deoxyglucose-6-phosphatase n=3 Tax=Candidatus Magasanikiibacteriota TaxID=1752731 RepID=A0A1F6NE12_9BACT|nr:MAG: hypothetical protein A2224_03570 [Candidatus Magasanikbacteria bacterium RIFOXYA2_FULL_40_20]OGH82058.1 MAG: hypothetical protein A2373_03420 [Candidatus Magasanikbacteria bacterium RIFOXYB1_FULL_40_15]OGH85073.1 MAG: hypothetical protein A2301_02615 [Candidatus Magasanikbacteria bacterium RIFOXYB2_FULL_40_13]OGH87676.1 MAG: hypothetical protein A2206_02445 [Candidatus Magasanikbacteria bacterium RIFOXYA1_FULL_40_8]OGH90255.1 MAG: hypothetical protein A2469_03595 [Candidatus Magasanikba